jgi:hypothetical protein
VLALMLALGTLASTDSWEAEGDPSQELGEESEWLVPHSSQAVARARCSTLPDHDAPASRPSLRASLVLAPPGPMPSRPTWERPRRVPPSDDDDDETMT